MAVDNNILQVQALLDKVNETLNEQITLYNTLAETTNKYGSAKSTTPSSIINIQKETEAVNTSIEKTRLAEIKLDKAREEAFDKYDRKLKKQVADIQKAHAINERNIQKEQANLEKANSLYNQAQLKVNELTKKYNDLAIKKELGTKLTTTELTQLSRLTNEINIYQKALIKVDADIQKNNRSVGNYAKGWNGLGNSINQLTREAPAFANSVQTGFMALSNNLPILFDEITNVKNANKELIAQGKPIQSTFSQIAGAILSWQTLLSVGVTVLTLYGAKIWDSISGSKEKKIALEAEKKAVEDKIEAEKRQNEAIGQSIASEQNRARILFEIAKNAEVSDKKRNDALKELRERYGKYLTDLSNQQILAGETADAEERLNEALLGRGYALATISLLEQNASAQMSLQVEYQKTLAKSFKQLNDLRADDGSIKNMALYNKTLRDVNLKNVDAMKILNEKLKPLKEEEAVILSIFRGNAKYLDAVNETGEAKSKIAEKDKQYQTNSKDAFEKNIKALQEQLDALDRFNPIYDTINGLLIIQKQLYEQLFETVKQGQEEIKQGQEEIKQGLELTEEQVYIDYYAWLKLRDATDEYIKTLTSGFIERGLDSIGLSALKMFTDVDSTGMSTFDKLMDGANTAKEKFAVAFQAIGDVAQDVFNKIAEMTQANFENEYNTLERRSQIAIAFANGDENAIAEIERQKEQRRKDIAKREFQAKKDMALFNIAIDTAQAVVASIALSPLTFGMPYAGYAIAIGALQAGLVLSQKMPEFYKGTDNAPEGLAWTQERGAEVITDKKGRVKTLGSNKGAVLTKLEAGDKVYTAQKSKQLMFNSDFSEVLFNSSLSNMMQSAGIGMSDTKPQIDIRQDLHQLGRDVVSAINNKTEYHQTFDNNGINNYISNGHTRKQIKNNHVTFTKQSY